VTTSGKAFIDLLAERGILHLVGGKVGLFRRDEASAAGKLLAWAGEGGFWVENPRDWSQRTRKSTHSPPASLSTF